MMSRLMVRRRVQSIPCVESVLDKDNQAACPIDTVTTMMQVKFEKKEI